ncbi:hypothetical protein FOZG_13723 [Fusarium oxysporum Fo47]|uniref:Methyltransferase type 11 domain-containing protein n=1 Tax=Fusarium oxysporum Fo47 TaxID=660027 RepID=W9JXW7_FUSOX|nr:hypothetical protein FOZG_13723 [Fusarium oxysporum Fo47]
MSIYGRATFSAAGYAAARPTYPATLYKTILGYYHHEDPHGTLLDLGSGHGIVARELSPRFARAIAIDPSAGMMQQGMQATAQFSKISFRQGSAEDLSFLPAHSVDMAVAGESAHWFDYPRVWPELSRVVKSGGSLAFWGYKDNIIIGHPQANKIFERFCYGEGDVSPGLGGLNQYWERPARDILRGLLADVKPPGSHWDKIKRITYNVDKDTTEVADAETAWMRSKINLGQFEAYVRAFTAYRGWMDAHPDNKSRAEGGEGDIVDILFDQILEAEPEWKAQGDRWRDIEVESHLLSYQVISDGVHTFESGKYGQRSIPFGNAAYQTFAATTTTWFQKPYQHLLLYIKVDSLGDNILHYVEKQFPIIKKPTQVLYNDTKDLISLSYHKGLEGRDHVPKVYDSEYKKNKQVGLVAHGKAAVTTVLGVSNEALSWLSRLLHPKKAEATNTVN